ncbi:hypothetical protein [Mycolicibacterium sp. HS_4_1]
MTNSDQVPDGTAAVHLEPLGDRLSATDNLPSSGQITCWAELTVVIRRLSMNRRCKAPPRYP